MTVAITGATSMLGVATIKEFLNSNDSILAFLRKGSANIFRLPNSPLLHVIECDLNELADFNVANLHADAFIHFSWDHTAKDTRDDVAKQCENVKYTIEAVKLAKRLGCKKFIGAGSQAEYGYVDGVITEQTTCNPASAYGIAKLSANLFSRKLCGQLGMVQIWGRIFSVYGTNDNKDTMIDYALNNLLNDKVTEFSSGEQNWNYLFEDDAGKIFYLLATKNIKGGEYLIAHPKSQKLKDYVYKIADVIGKLELIKFDKNYTPYGLNVNISKLEDAIGELDYVDFSDGIKRIIRREMGGGEDK